MARTRNLKPDFFKNEDLADLCIEARYLFQGLWTLADREGRLEDRPRKIKAQIFPYDPTVVEPLLEQLAEHKEAFIKRYEVNGKKYIWITNFRKNQKIHPKEAPSELPPHPDDIPFSIQNRGFSRQGVTLGEPGDNLGDTQQVSSREKVIPSNPSISVSSSISEPSYNSEPPQPSLDLPLPGQVVEEVPSKKSNGTLFSIKRPHGHYREDEWIRRQLIEMLKAQNPKLYIDRAVSLQELRCMYSSTEKLVRSWLTKPTEQRIAAFVYTIQDSKAVNEFSYALKALEEMWDGVKKYLPQATDDVTQGNLEVELDV